MIIEMWINKRGFFHEGGVEGGTHLKGHKVLGAILASKISYSVLHVTQSNFYFLLRLNLH